MGDSSGSVTRNSRRTGPKPSSSAASRSWSGIACRPASTITKVSPMFCQIDVSATPRSALSLRERSMKATLPNLPTFGLTRPKNTTDATATEVATVEEKIPWKTLMPLSFRCAASASSRPRTSPVGTV